MPKMKTKKAVTKRFKITKSGKVKRARSCKSHILTKKSRKRKRNLRRGSIVKGEAAKMLKRLMPYG